jgi:hypothetical protein
MRVIERTPKVVNLQKIIQLRKEHKKREAIEQAYTDVSPDTKPQWEGNQNLIEWLRSFNK